MGAGAGLNQAWDVVKRLWRADSDGPPVDLERHLADVRANTPAPVFWLLGKTQSGKTSIIRHLTGAEDAAIGSGFRPCTKSTRQYQFPTPEAPLVTFLDTRGVDEPGYDPAEDIAAFDAAAHLVLVTARVGDFAQATVKAALAEIRRRSPGRPVVLALTTLHEAYPRRQHPQPYPFADSVAAGKLDPHAAGAPDDLARRVEEQLRQFDGLYDAAVPIDLTKPDEGFDDPNYGGDALKRALVDNLPGAYRQTLLHLDDATRELKDLHLKHALPVIMGYSSLAASAGAVPVPFLDLLLIPGVQARMVNHLARLYRQPMTGQRFMEIAASLGIGIVARQAARELVKFIPGVGSVAGAALAWGSTYALGRAFCYYLEAVHEGHVPDTNTLRKIYHDQLRSAAEKWTEAHRDAPPKP